VLYVSDITLYSIRSGISSQWSFLRTGVMWWCFGVLVSACIYWGFSNSMYVLCCLITCIPGRAVLNYLGS